MERRAWRLTAGTVLLLLVLVGLVIWRGPALEGPWSTALTATAVLAVVGLSVAAVIAGLTAVRGPEPDEVVVRVPPTGPPSTSVRPAAGPPSRLRTALILALASALPVALVLVLSSAASAGSLGSDGSSAQGSDGGASDRASGRASDSDSGSGVPPATDDPSATSSAESPSPTASSPEQSGPATSGFGSASSSPLSSSSGTGVTPGGESLPPAPSPQVPSSALPAPPAPPAQPVPAEPSEPPPPVPPAEPSDGPDGGDTDSSPSVSCRYEVAAGDSLWALVEGRLGPEATNARVAAGTQALYAANADVIGDDPDLIQPGQELSTCT